MKYKEKKEKKPGISLCTQDGTGRSNEVGSNKLYLGRRLLQAVLQVVSVALVDERYISTYIHTYGR